ncbi:Putative ADP-ribosylation factor family protein [Penicillium brasilianum]|uniref:Putative ADP-ribosylation factor family protein n=1 Tax=Penicillium brasilianum TaxID=104259 RepID=A0A0F7TWJ4_PENBI|nr:Putative ADP-ribosylation factor family protein [Penicillium brasilianum]
MVHSVSDHQEEYSVLLLSLNNAGKTTLLSEIKALYQPRPDGTPAPNPVKTVPTVGQNVATISLSDMNPEDLGSATRSSSWSTAPTLAKIQISPAFHLPPVDARARYQVRHEGVSGIGTNEQFSDHKVETNAPGSGFRRLDECRQVLESALQSADAAGVPILVLAKKQDREDRVEVVRIKEGFGREVFEGETGSGVRDSRVLPVSALPGSGAQAAVEWVQSRVRWNKEGRPPVMR